MNKPIKVHPSKRRGRPATGKDPLVSARLPKNLITAIEALAENQKISRSDAVRRLIESGLQAWIEDQR
ncbi:MULTISPECIES: ribbon-helix-helix protein, CopG family [unclassified Bradyrhizobium]|uniref:Ribbon-helix-helix protein, CopG family n=1 Tax=Bradyrhizobium sp. LLZ17 TaxID=3239388 RepID=A0AB39XJH1_9BRAD